MPWRGTAQGYLDKNLETTQKSCVIITLGFDDQEREQSTKGMPAFTNENENLKKIPKV